MSIVDFLSTTTTDPPAAVDNQCPLNFQSEPMSEVTYSTGSESTTTNVPPDAVDNQCPLNFQSEPMREVLELMARRVQWHEKHAGKKQAGMGCMATECFSGLFLGIRIFDVLMRPFLIAILRTATAALKRFFRMMFLVMAIAAAIYLAAFATLFVVAIVGIFLLVRAILRSATTALIGFFRIAFCAFSIVAALHLASLILCLWDAEPESCVDNHIHLLKETGGELLRDFLRVIRTIDTISEACFFLRDAARTITTISVWFIRQSFFFLRGIVIEHGAAAVT